MCLYYFETANLVPFPVYLCCITHMPDTVLEYLVLVKEMVLCCLQTRQQARSTNRAPKARGTSASAQVRFDLQHNTPVALVDLNP